MQFVSWRDSYLFLKEYGSFTCLQCKASNHNLDTSVEHTDGEYARFFCSKRIDMVRLDFQFTCDEWENEDGETLKEFDMDKCIFNLPDEVIEVLSDTRNGKWTIEEVRELVNEHEKTVE